MFSYEASHRDVSVRPPRNLNGDRVMTVTSRKKRNPLTTTTTKTMTDGSPLKSVSWQKPLARTKIYEAENISRKVKSQVEDLTPVEPERDEDMSEEVEARALASPSTPTRTEREEHNVTHLPFRSWCSACVRGRAKAHPHFRLSQEAKEAEEIPVISFDYGFVGPTSGDSHAPVLVAKDRRSKACWAWSLNAKGAEDPAVAASIVRMLNLTGYKRVSLKSDQEHCLRVCLNEAKNVWKGEAFLEAAPKGEKASNGEVE